MQLSKTSDAKSYEPAAPHFSMMLCTAGSCKAFHATHAHRSMCFDSGTQAPPGRTAASPQQIPISAT